MTKKKIRAPQSVNATTVIHESIESKKLRKVFGLFEMRVILISDVS
jgi:hypothetical protein